MKNHWNSPLQRLVLSGLLAGVILLLTIVVAIPIPHMAGAYVNLGDVGVYLAAFLLGPWGALSAAVGSALADLLLGSALYSIPTFVIKGCMALIAGNYFVRHKKHTLPALALGGIVMPLGYFLFETTIYGAQAALLGVPANLLQYIAGVALGVPVLRVVQKLMKTND